MIVYATHRNHHMPIFIHVLVLTINILNELNRIIHMVIIQCKISFAGKISLYRTVLVTDKTANLVKPDLHTLFAKAH